MSSRKMSVDMTLLVLTMVLVGIGVVMIYSASYTVAGEKFGSPSFFVVRHLIRLGMGIMCLYITMNIDYHKWAKVDKILLLIGIAALAFLLVNKGVASVNGAKRWIRFAGFSFQPSEFIKLVLVIFMARSLSEKQDKLSVFSEGLLPHLAIVGLVAGLIAAEPNFSTALVVSVIIVGMIFVAGARLSHLSLIGVSLLPVIYILLLRAPYRRARLLAFFDSGNHLKDIGYQAYQAIIGLGAGGLFGSGLGQSRQKLFYLPEPYTDFVFAVLGEEMGFIGAIVVLALFAFFIWRGMKISLSAPDVYGYLLGFGITTMLMVYVLFHIGVATSLLPTTGIPMPFISYGGMSLIFTMAAVGILLNISGQSRDIYKSKNKRNKIFYHEKT